MQNRPANRTWQSSIIPIALILGFVALITLNSDTQARQIGPLEAWLKQAILYVAIAAEVAAGLVIAAGVINALYSFVRHFFLHHSRQAYATEEMRLRLGLMLTLALEFTVASDILRMTVSPTRQDILNLGMIVLLRTLLVYFLEAEIRQAEERRGEAEAGVLEQAHRGAPTKDNQAAQAAETDEQDDQQ
jgi:uncharacterized membrane protein